MISDRHLSFSLSSKPHASMGWPAVGRAGMREKAGEAGSDPTLSTLGQGRTILIFGSGFSCHLQLALLEPGVRGSARKFQEEESQVLKPALTPSGLREPGCRSLRSVRTTVLTFVLAKIRSVHPESCPGCSSPLLPHVSRGVFPPFLWVPPAPMSPP